MVATFSPPLAYDVPRVLPDTRGVAYLLMRHYSPMPRGRSVVFRNGHFVTTDVPDNAELAALVEGETFFLGGHVYAVTDAIAALLVADGYVVDTEGPGEYQDIYDDLYQDVF